MNTKRHSIEVNGIPVKIVRKDIKNLHLAVYPPGGSIRVAAPYRLSDDAIGHYVPPWLDQEMKSRFRATRTPIEKAVDGGLRTPLSEAQAARVLGVSIATIRR